MCLMKLTDKAEKAALAKLSNTFPCWKVISPDGYCQFQATNNEPKFVRGKVHTAADRTNWRRVLLDYVPSFHAYLNAPVLITSYRRNGHKVVKCWAEKKDLVRIGYPKDTVGITTRTLSVAVSKITRK